MTPGEFVTVVLGAAGGTSVVVLGLGGWLGKVWAARLVEAEKTKHKQQEHVYEAKFAVYYDLWKRLQDVKVAADALWDHASVDRLDAFRIALQKARLAIGRGRLLLEERHYTRLNHIIGVFQAYEVGKRKLIEIRTRAELDAQLSHESEYRIEKQIASNDALRHEYSDLLDQIVTRFRQALGTFAA